MIKIRVKMLLYSFNNLSILQRMGPSYRSGPGFCPTINATESQEILVSSGIKKAIRVKVHIIGVCQEDTIIKLLIV